MAVGGYEHIRWITKHLCKYGGLIIAKAHLKPPIRKRSLSNS